MSIVQGIDANSVSHPLLLDASGRAIVIGTGAGGTVPVSVSSFPSPANVTLLHNMPNDGTAQRVKVSTTFVATARQNVTVVAFDSLAWYFVRKLVIDAGSWTAGAWATPAFNLGGVNYMCGSTWTIVAQQMFSWDINVWVTGAINLVIDAWQGIATKSFDAFAHYDKVNL